MLTVEQIANAIEKKAGNITEAAKALRVTRQALHKRIKDDEDLQELVTQQREALVDIAESALLKQIKRGNTAAIIFALKTQGRDRGYIERIEQEHKGSINLNVKGYVNISPDDWDTASAGKDTSNSNL